MGRGVAQPGDRRSGTDGLKRADAIATQPVLECRGVERRFGGLVALTGVDLQIERGEIFGLVGPNGSGKTTLTNAITGFYPPQRGSIAAERPRHHRDAAAPVARLGVARTFQNLALFNGMTVLDNILLGRHVHMRPSVVRTALLQLARPPRRDAPPRSRSRR